MAARMRSPVSPATAAGLASRRDTVIFDTPARRGTAATGACPACSSRFRAFMGGCRSSQDHPHIQISYAIQALVVRQLGPIAGWKVMAAMASMHPAIEIIDSRYADLGAMDPLSQRADQQNHGA